MSNPKAQSGLVTNEEAATQSIVSLTVNITPKSVRNDTLQGVDYVVVPMVILTEGVHEGSMGPLYYPADELKKTPQVWNHKPVVVYHPTMNGQGISACDKDVINTRSVGVMMNTRWEDGKLKSEAWIRKDHANRIDVRIMNAVEEGEMMELSTGVFVDTEQVEGKFGDEAYTGIARNYRPDHLALLPDQIGACSLKDGAGFLRNAKKNIPKDVLERALEKAGLSMNEISHDDIRSALSTALQERFGKTGLEENSVWVMDTFQNFVVFYDGGTLFRIGYTSNDVEVQLSEEQPEEVVRVSEYRTVNNNTESKDTMEKNIKKLTDTIIGNAKWSDADRKKLGELPEEKLVAMAEMKEANPHFAFNLSEPVAPKVETPKVETPAKVEAPAANVKTGDPAPTVEAYIAAAPAGMKDVLTNSLDMHNQEKARLVTEITANENNTFTPAELDARPLNELRKMAQLMGTKVVPEVRPPNYAGQAPVPAGNAEAETPLVMPAMNFGKESK